MGTLLACACSSSEDATTPQGQSDAGPDGPGTEDVLEKGEAAADDAGDSSSAANCFQQHLQEAIVINSARKPLYSALTNGASEKLSDQLVQSEQLGVTLAKSVDDKARPYQDAGVSIVCDDFVSMSLVPAFKESFETPPPPLSEFKKVDGVALKASLKSAYESGGFAQLATELASQSATLSATPSYNCMTRHLIDSLLRIATYAPVHDQHAAQAGLGSTLPLSEEMFNLHLLTVDQATQLDADAAPIQASGVPFLCQDVPSIEPYQP